MMKLFHVTTAVWADENCEAGIKSDFGFVSMKFVEDFKPFERGERLRFSPGPIRRVGYAFGENRSAIYDVLRTIESAGDKAKATLHDLIGEDAVVILEFPGAKPRTLVLPVKALEAYADRITQPGNAAEIPDAPGSTAPVTPEA